MDGQAALRQAQKPQPGASRYQVREDGQATKDIPIERIIGGPSFRSSQDDDLLQMAVLIAHALNRQASRRDLQGVVRR